MVTIIVKLMVKVMVRDRVMAIVKVNGNNNNMINTASATDKN